MSRSGLRCFPLESASSSIQQSPHLEFSSTFTSASMSDLWLVKLAWYEFSMRSLVLALISSFLGLCREICRLLALIHASNCLVPCRPGGACSLPEALHLDPAKFWKVWTYASKGSWSINPVRTYRNMSTPEFWEKVRPSRIPAAQRPSWMTYDDAWIDELRRGLKACAVFLYLPLYW
jgi:hypothetical protein